MTGFNGIPMRGIRIPRTQTLGGSHVLPARPYAPDMPTFDSVDISRDSLPARNAETQLKSIGFPLCRLEKPAFRGNTSLSG